MEKDPNFEDYLEHHRQVMEAALRGETKIYAAEVVVEATGEWRLSQMDVVASDAHLDQFADRRERLAGIWAELGCIVTHKILDDVEVSKELDETNKQLQRIRFQARA